jgi:hypothetical protein
MLESTPWLLDVAFFATALTALLFFHWSNERPARITMLLLVWGLLQCVLAYNGFFENVEARPPRFGLVLIPGFMAIGYGLTPKALRWAAARRNLYISTFLHSVRLPVELTLHYLFTLALVPELMTYTGRNFDVIIGITAPIVGYLYYKGQLSASLLLVWNVVGLLLVGFILVNGVLSSELPFQQFAFDQPNAAMKYAPYVLLPALIVPLVIYTHLTDLLLLKKKKNESAT